MRCNPARIKATTRQERTRARGAGQVARWCLPRPLFFVTGSNVGWQPYLTEKFDKSKMVTTSRFLRLAHDDDRWLFGCPRTSFPGRRISSPQACPPAFQANLGSRVHPPILPIPNATCTRQLGIFVKPLPQSSYSSTPAQLTRMEKGRICARARGLFLAPICFFQTESSV